MEHDYIPAIKAAIPFKFKWGLCKKFLSYSFRCKNMALNLKKFSSILFVTGVSVLNIPLGYTSSYSLRETPSPIVIAETQDNDIVTPSPANDQGLSFNAFRDFIVQNQGLKLLNIQESNRFRKNGINHCYRS